MAWDLGARQLLVETDNLKVFNWVTGKEEADNSHDNVVFECKNWYVRDWKVMLNQISREGNTAADALAKLGLRLHYRESKRWNTPSESLRLIMEHDAKESQEVRKLTQ